MTDFLLELRSEEIPARMQAGARSDLERLFRAELMESGIEAEGIETYSTPRRLALIARGLPLETEAVREERRGPRADAPDKAIKGFLGSVGMTRDQLEEREDKKGRFLFAVIERPGRATREVLAGAIPKLIRGFPWPKSMRWGPASTSPESLRWVRPLQGIVAILGEELVECAVDGIASGVETVGHRFHHPGAITIGGADDYLEKLNACHVIVDQAERERIVREGAARAAADAELELVADDGLVIENAGLTEWPVPLLGGFDPAFLEVPEEVIQLTARVNQKYFICRDGEGRLAPHFVCTANIEASDGGAAIVAGNEKVLAARLSDARFFWEQDRQKTLAQHAERLGEIVFHEKLGTVADKVDRVATLARWLVEQRIVTPAKAGVHSSGAGAGGGDGVDSSLRWNDEAVAALADKAETAARLAKADLVTGMVGEFPELQGVMGGYYAEAEGLDPEIAAAIRDHYKPVGQGDEVPTAPVTVAVSLADKIDTLVAFFAADEEPTSSRDPQGIRRAGLGLVSLIEENDLRIPLAKYFGIQNGAILMTWGGREIAEKYGESYRDFDSEKREEIYLVEVAPVLKPVGWGPVTDVAPLLLFFLSRRLVVQQREAGVRHDLIDAVFALGGEDDLVRLLARVKALQAFVETEDGANLLAGYKRAANILKKEGGAPAQAGAQARDDETGFLPAQERGFPYDPEPAEAALAAALDEAEPRAAAAVEAEDFEGAMAALASLRAPIDAFFNSVTVNDPDPAKRAHRLQMLERMRDAVHRVADFSKIEG